MPTFTSQSVFLFLFVNTASFNGVLGSEIESLEKQDKRGCLARRTPHDFKPRPTPQHVTRSLPALLTY